MKIVGSVLLLCASAVATSAVACDNPTMVIVPDGATATMDELLEAQAEVREYMSAMEEYLACLNGELEAAGEDAPDQFRALMVNRHNQAVGEMEAIAASFNEQINAYREANPEE